MRLKLIPLKTILYTLILGLGILSIFLSIFCYTIMQEIAITQAIIDALILDINNLRNQLNVLENHIEEMRKLSLVVLPNPVPNALVLPSICIGVILFTLVGSKFFFAATPFFVNYTAKSWSYGFFSYFYPLNTMSGTPKNYADALGNVFKIVFDTNVNTFIIQTKIVGAQVFISVASFIEVVLGL